jgi:hypothetical protein
MKFLRALFAGLVTSTGASAPSPATSKSPAEMMRAMRTGWLTRVPEKGSYKSQDEVVTVVMDWPLGEQTVTVLSSSAGDASLYTTSTFGIIGGIGHEKVRKAALVFVGCAQRFLKLTTATREFPYPDNRTLRLFMVTPSGVRTVSFPLNDIDRSDSPARALYAAGQDVVTELRLITPNQK